MNYKSKIEEIRSLLDKYYTGETSPADQQRLKELFATIDEEALPEDLKADKTMCDGMCSLDAADTSITIPEELSHRLELITDPDKSISLWVSIQRYAAIAAAVAVLAIVTFVAVHLTTTSNPVDLVASNTVEADTTGINTTPPEVTTPEILEPPATLEAQTTPTDLITASATPTAKITYREVTDIDEAQAIATRCAQLLAIGNQQTVRAADDIDTQLNQVYKIITNI